MFEIDDETKEAVRAQVGIGTLIVFIAMVLVAAIAAGVLINTAGFLQSKSETTGQESSEQVTNRLQVLQATGLETKQDDRKIGAVELIVTKAPGADDIAMEGLTMQWVDNSGTYDLIHERSYVGNVDGEFAHTAIKDDDGSLNTESSPVINTGDDRALIQIDIGNTENAGDLTAYNGTAALTQPENGQADAVIRADDGGLPEGETASLRITTQSGTASTVQLTVPESLSGKSAVRL